MEDNDQQGRRPRKQISCSECRKRKQKCVFTKLDAPCLNCAKRFPAVDCVANRSAAAQIPGLLRQEKIFDLASWTELPHDDLVVRASGARWRLHCQSQSQSQTHADDDAAEEVEEHCTPPAAALAVWARPTLVLEGRGDPNAILRPVGGLITEITTLNAFPLEGSARNTELLHFYLRNVAPNLVSIDGQSQPAVFKTAVLPWQLQSPLMPTIGILMASTAAGLDRGFEIERNPESLLVKAKVLGYINRFLTAARGRGGGGGNFAEAAAEVVKSVLSLIVMEWFWGTDESMRAHTRGVKELIRTCGGLRGLNDVVAEAITILTDYELACCFETDLHWLFEDPEKHKEDIIITMPDTVSPGFDCPLVQSHTSFSSIRESLGLTAEAARILDDVRFLTVSITTPPAADPVPTMKIRSTASWLHSRLQDPPPQLDSDSRNHQEEEHVETTIRLAALLYSWSISSVTMLSSHPSASLHADLYESMMRVSLTRWKATPGIFLWIMLVLSPGTRSDRRGRFIRRKMAVTGLSIGFEDFRMGIPYLRGFWLVQRWVASQRAADMEKQRGVRTSS